MIEVLTENSDDFTSGLWVTTRLVLASFVAGARAGDLGRQRCGSQPVGPCGGSPRSTRRCSAACRCWCCSSSPIAGVRRGGVEIDQWTAGILSLGVYTSAYVAEALRSGMSRGRRGPGRGRRCRSGSPTPNVLRRIVLPQAFRTVIAPLGSITIAMIKNSAIVGASIVALDDLLKEARIVNSNTFQTHEAFFWGAVGYLLLTVTVTVVFRDPRIALRGASMSYLFDPDNWEWLWTSNNARFLLEAFLINIEIALIAMVFSLLFGLALALLSISRVTPVRLATKLWVDVFRNLPLIFLILYLALTLPESVKDFWDDNAPGWLPEALQSKFILAGIGGLVLYNSAVLAEIMRAGILSLERGQREAAAALGLTYRQQMRHVVLPQGLRRMVPATVSQLITLNKDTTLVSIIGIQELVRSGRILPRRQATRSRAAATSTRRSCT